MLFLQLRPRTSLPPFSFFFFSVFLVVRCLSIPKRRVLSPCAEDPEPLVCRPMSLQSQKKFQIGLDKNHLSILLVRVKSATSRTALNANARTITGQRIPTECPRECCGCSPMPNDYASRKKSLDAAVIFTSTRVTLTCSLSIAVRVRVVTTNP